LRASLRRVTPLVAIALTLSLVLGGAVRAESAHAGAVPALTTGALRICSGCADYGLSSSRRYSYVILNSWQASLIPTLKAKNPGVKVLMYKDIAATLSYACSAGVDNTKLPAGLGYCWTAANHPDWFLTDTNGARIEFCDFAGAWQMDVGNAAYQQQWLDNVLADLRSAAWDGVMLDDVNQSETWHLCGRTISRYPTSDQYGDATERFLARVAPGLRSGGYLAMPNIALDDWWTSSGLARWDRWIAYGSGTIQEYFSKWGRDSGRWLTDDGVHNEWSGRQALFARTQATGKAFIGITYAPSSDSRSMRYARASFLLDWNGGASTLVFEPTTPEAQDPYAAQWTTDLGSPRGTRVKVGVAWKRSFSGGIVVLNPSPSATQTVDLAGRYVLPDGTTGSTITVGPADAALLKTSSAGRRPPVPANTHPPTITVAKSGTALSASAGSWHRGPKTFTYRWLRCGSTGRHCAAITGASSRAYLLRATDLGKRLRVAVTAVNAAGASTSTSKPTPKVRRTAVRQAVRPRRPGR
jgi:hypothetical protein